MKIDARFSLKNKRKEMINVKGCELGATTHLANLFFLVIDLFFQKILFQSYFIDCDDFGS